MNTENLELQSEFILSTEPRGIRVKLAITNNSNTSINLPAIPGPNLIFEIDDPLGKSMSYPSETQAPNIHPSVFKRNEVNLGPSKSLKIEFDFFDTNPNAPSDPRLPEKEKRMAFTKKGQYNIKLVLRDSKTNKTISSSKSVKLHF
ncbi:MAG: hypothetical protein AB8E15_12410 [Bdellovibrionales bacterium]